MDSKLDSFNLSWWQRKKYTGRFVAYIENEIITSGKSYWDCRHKAREKLAEQKLTQTDESKLNKDGNVQYYYVEKKSNIYRGLFIVFLGFIIFEKLMYDLMLFDSIPLYKKLEFFFFYNFVLLSIFLSSLVIINPVVRTQSVFGLMGKAIINKERHLGWEVSLSGISAFIFLGSIVVYITASLEFDVKLNTTYIFFLGILLAVQAWFSTREEKNLKKLHYYLIDQITLEDRLSYEEIASYLSDVPEIKKRGLSNSNSILLTLEASLESPFSLTRVIAFHILFRDLGIMIGSIITSFAIGYLLYYQGIVNNLIGSRIFASLLAAGLLISYALIKRSTSDLFAEGFVKNKPHFTLRPGGVDRIYMKFFPEEVLRMKRETISTILSQSVRLTAGLGIFFLLYGIELLITIGYIDDYETVELINSITLAIGVIPMFLFILYVAKMGTDKWVNTIEKELLDLDQQLESQIGMSPNEILSYLQEAQDKYTQIYSKKK